MKKSLLSFGLLVVSFFAFSLGSTVVEADENIDLDTLSLEQAKQLGNVTYQDESVVAVDFGDNQEIQQLIENNPDTVTAETPRTRNSVTGPGGTARIYGSGNRRQLYWSVKPNTRVPWVFKGTVSWTFRNGRKGSTFASTLGAVGVGGSGVVYLVQNSGGSATLRGDAYSSNGKWMTVLPGCYTNF